VDFGLLRPFIFRLIFEESVISKFPDEMGGFRHEDSVESVGSFVRPPMFVFEIGEATA